MGFQASVYVNKSIKPKHMILIGLFAIAISALIIWLNYSRQEEAKDYTETHGRVVDHDSRYDDGSTIYSEVVEYNVNGSSYYCRSDSYSSFPKSIGSAMKVKYDENNPSKCLLENKTGNYIVYIVGGVFVVIGIGLVVLGLRGNHSSNNEEEI